MPKRSRKKTVSIKSGKAKVEKSMASVGLNYRKLAGLIIAIIGLIVVVSNIWATLLLFVGLVLIYFGLKMIGYDLKL